METVEKLSRIEKLIPLVERSAVLVGIMVKEPLAGQVKTRLCPPLTPEEAARLYAVMMQETVQRLAAGPIPVVLFYAGSAAYFEKLFPGLPLWPQASGDLGQRLNEAMDHLLATGCRSAALIGSDSPDLPLAQVDAAFAALVANDVVTIPAGDGGYVLVGCSRPCAPLFEGIAWSTAAVLEQTRRQAEQQGLRYAEIGGWGDIDDIAALRDLLQRAPETATARFARLELAAKLESGPVGR